MDSPHDLDRESGAMSRPWVERDAAVVWHGFTQMGSFADNAPLIIERAEGRDLIDADGRRYLDAILDDRNSSPVPPCRSHCSWTRTLKVKSGTSKLQAIAPRIMSSA